MVEEKTKRADIETKTVSATRGPDNSFLCHETIKAGPRAVMATQIMGLLLSRRGEPLPDPKEMVEYSCLVTEIASEEFLKRGWVVMMPSVDDLVDEDGDATSTGFLRR